MFLPIISINAYGSAYAEDVVTTSLNNAVVGDEFRMHAGFLTDIHNTFQIIIIFQRKRDRDLVQLVLRKNILQILAKEKRYEVNLD